MIDGLAVTVLWVLVISGVGMLPRRFHWRFGFPMLMLFPLVLAYLAYDKGMWWALGLCVAALSIYRYPAKHYGLALLRKATGKPSAE